MLTGMWCLMAVVLINSFTGNLTSYLSVPKLNPIPNSFEELAASSNYKLSIQANSVLMKSITVKMFVTNTNLHKYWAPELRLQQLVRTKYSEIFFARIQTTQLLKLLIISNILFITTVHILRYVNCKQHGIKFYFKISSLDIYSSSVCSGSRFESYGKMSPYCLQRAAHFVVDKLHFP